MAETKQPKWWSPETEASWQKVKNAVVGEWHKVADGAKKIEKVVAEQAIAFGHGARDAYGRMGTWSADVEKKLKADWESTRHEAGETWDKVRDAVKHGWDKTVHPTPKS
jgi:hypothetical protein